MKKTHKKLLLHACCGPCSLEPVKLLSDYGWDITIMFSNSNIYPKSEYDKRLNTLITWANSQRIKVIADKYDNKNWSNIVEPFGQSAPGTESRKKRCGACYLQRFRRAAEYAAANNFDTISSTLSVSPFQYTKMIEWKLKQAAKQSGISFLFYDFRSNYNIAVKRSIQLGMYRQHYCGCEFSLRESFEQQKLAIKKKEYNQKIQNQIKEQAENRRKQKKEYQTKQARKRMLKKQYKQKHKS